MTNTKDKKNKDMLLSKAAAVMASKSASPAERRHAASILGRVGGKHRINDCNKIDEVSSASTTKGGGFSD